MNITFNDFGQTSQEIDIYLSNGTLVTTAKSNETVANLQEEFYQFVFRPVELDILSNPGLLWGYIESGFTIIFLFLFMVYLYRYIKKR